jgi:hypothetical protein
MSDYHEATINEYMRILELLFQYLTDNQIKTPTKQGCIDFMKLNKRWANTTKKKRLGIYYLYFKHVKEKIVNFGEHYDDLLTVEEYKILRRSKLGKYGLLIDICHELPIGNDLFKLRLGNIDFERNVIDFTSRNNSSFTKIYKFNEKVKKLLELQREHAVISYKLDKIGGVLPRKEVAHNFKGLDLAYLVPQGYKKHRNYENGYRRMGSVVQVTCQNVLNENGINKNFQTINLYKKFLEK